MISEELILQLALLVFLFPLVGMVIHMFFGSRMPRRGDWFATLMVFIPLGITAYLFYLMFSSGEKFFINFSVPWLNLGNKVIEAGMLIDNFTIVMLGVVTLVAAFVHLYSVGYMHGDKRYCRYYTYLLLFTTAMLGLVLSNNLLTLYVFWELVGFTSYLLIGFWFEKDSAANAGKKAFITTRIGDVGMFFGILLIYFHVGSLNYTDVFRAVADGSLSENVRLIAGLGIFLGAMGKSAQFPLHVWLPDAMEGPTPISALIHAATMVAAGVYLVGRMFPLFTPTSLLVIAYIGGFTAIFAGTIAIVRDDIKRVLAYSTVSQLGYMMLGLGVGSFVAGLFHLTTHACFKALLFLGSGSVIHAVETNSMRQMGGLLRKMPITAITFLIGTLALIGFPGFAGFYSKDRIIMESLKFGLHHKGHYVLFLFGALTAGITAFYMFRLFFKTFLGKPRDQERYHHAHESPLVMTIPLMVLAVFSVVAGYGNWFQRHVPTPTLAHYLQEPGVSSTEHAAATGSPIIQGKGGEEKSASLTEHEHEKHLEHLAHRGTMLTALPLTFLGIIVAYLMFFRGTISSRALINRFRPLYTLLWRKYYIDEFYHYVVGSVFWAAVWLAGAFDRYVIDGLVNFSGLATRISSWFAGRFDLGVVDGTVNRTAWTTGALGNMLSVWQSGKVRQYVLFSLLGLCVLVVAILWIR